MVPGWSLTLTSPFVSALPSSLPVLQQRLAHFVPSGRSRLGSLPGFAVASTGSYVPEQIVTNEDLASLGCDSDWIVQRTGILQRRRVAPGQSASDLAYEASKVCLDSAGVAPSEVDLIIVATMTPDHATPSTACHLQKRLGCIAPAFDLNAACAGFMYAMATAAQFVANGFSKKALVVGSEVMSQTVNPADVKTYPLFGDGAGAALIVPAAPSPDQPNGFLAYTLGAEGCGGQMLCVPAGGSRMPLTADNIDQGLQYLHMDGRSVFKWAVRVIEDSVTDVMGYCHAQPSDISQVILHQANIRIIDAAVSDFGVDRNRIFVNLDRYGNTSAASIPLALDEAVRAGKIQREGLIVLCGFGAGLSWGTCVLRW